MKRQVIHQALHDGDAPPAKRLLGPSGAFKTETFVLHLDREHGSVKMEPEGEKPAPFIPVLDRICNRFAGCDLEIANGFRLEAAGAGD